MNDQDKIQALKNGNTQVLEALMDMVEQSFQHVGDLVYHNHMSCDEHAIEVLIQAGVVEELNYNLCRLLWDKLEERKAQAAEYAKSRQDEVFNRNR